MNVYATDGKVAGVILSRSDEPEVVEVTDPEQKEIRIGDTVFRLVPDARSFNFHDWLRRLDGKIIGVRDQLFTNSYELDEKLISSIECFRNVEIVHALFEYRIYLGPERDFDDEKSGEQLFCYAEYFEGDDGTVMLTFHGPIECTETILTER